MQQVDEICEYGQWSDCNVTCGTGYKIRVRLESINNENAEECNQLPETEMVQCYENCTQESEEAQDENEEGKFTFSKRETHETFCFFIVTTMHPSMEVRNQVATNIVEQGPSAPVIHCEVSKWSQWSRCEPIEGNCGPGFQRKTRVIRVHASNGGRRCPKRLMRRRSCNKKCPNEKSKQRSYSNYEQLSDPLLPSWGPGGLQMTSP